jgi:hypothetical protein
MTVYEVEGHYNYGGVVNLGSFTLLALAEDQRSKFIDRYDWVDIEEIEVVEE